MPLVIASCSNRKRQPAVARAYDLGVADLDTVGEAWFAALDGGERQSASSLYCGRSVRVAERAASCLGGALLFASAGLGWVDAAQLIPSYGLTIIEGEDRILDRLPGGVTARDWWQWINRRSPFAIALAAAVSVNPGIILVALPRAYLAMVADDLCDLPEQDKARLRIVQRSGALVDALTPWTLIYDDRLEGGAGHAGTLSDFAARAAVHFAEQVWPGREGEHVEAHNAAVSAALSGWSARGPKSGTRKSDDELRAIIAAHWDATGGRTTKLLRVLRDDLGIACEQSRFARLVSTMRREREQGQ